MMGRRERAKHRQLLPASGGRFWVGITAALRSVPSALARGAAAVPRAIVDLLIEDLCMICGRTSSEGPPATGRARWLAGGVEHRGPLRMTVINHPVCPRCVAGFDETRRAACLGERVGGSAIRTVRGEWFGPPPPPVPTGGPASEPIRIVAPFMTNDNSLKIIHLIKFRSYRALVGPVAMSIAEAFEDTGGPPGGEPVLVGVPMAPAEERRRGFNPARDLAAALGAHLGIAHRPRAVKKVARTARQSRTRSEHRAANVRGAFAAAGHGLSDRHVILVDDLVTTGATAASCGSAILDGGARSVEILCFARSL